MLSLRGGHNNALVRIVCKQAAGPDSAGRALRPATPGGSRGRGSPVNQERPNSNAARASTNEPSTKKPEQRIPFGLR